MEEDLQHKQSELTKIEKKRQKLEEALKEKKKEAGTVQRETAKIEQEIREVVSTNLFIFSPMPVFSYSKRCNFHVAFNLGSKSSIWSLDSLSRGILTMALERKKQLKERISF